MKKKLLIIFLLALAVRIIWISTLDNTVDQWQEEGVKEAACNIIQGKGYVMPRSVSSWQKGDQPFYSWREPGFTFFLVPVFFFFGENYLVAKLLLAILSSLVAVITYYLAKETFGSEKVALTSAFIIALLPEMVYWTGYLTPESFTIFMVLLPVFFLMKSIKMPTILNLFFSGVFLGLAALTRAQIIVITPLLLASFVLVTGNRLKALKNAGLIFLFVFLTFSPWIMRSYRIHKQLVIMPTVAGEVFYIANNPGTLKMINDPAGTFHGEDPALFQNMSEVEITRWYRKEALRFIFSQPKDYVRLVANRFVRFWRLYPHLGVGVADHIYGRSHLWVSLLTSGITILFFWMGAFISLKKWREGLLLLVLILSFSSLTILGRVAIRYRLPIMPYVIIFATYGFYSIRGCRRIKLSICQR
ncbi:MAG: hypothetical protein COX46_02840 [bacterium (Candidatus Ratteibacteria) CG23_combo_of_CG06-09_8_20_14_all_48_7]|uniref:Glycosyltransferase RgtA/B/C/D-like domain-containing protein n=1 Tax=bacterium (Candidatus Ratteibacteria) CG23_combo_of_CG06-09_8_20_14_all_48_7 TaxID=2014292 RepID=A0A2G9YAS5_9BACT|nr:MAG: hypothetical protein COX46_02840 [bacterium (Candidatus Ratteibacteria) CG23_combo_of_CG06-09_8_20_14_all_48_7]